MKPHLWILAALLASIGCRRERDTVPPVAAPAPAITCPPGTAARGGPPPGDDRTWCERADGTMHGPVIGFFEDGRHRLEGSYDAGAKHGAWRTFYADGTRRSEENYDHAVPTGTWATFFADGKPASESVHRDAHTVAFRSFDPNGRTLREGMLVDGREQGEWKELDANGNLVTVRHGVGAEVPSGPVGIAPCDEYIVKFSRCIAEKVPETARAQMNEAMQVSIAAWKEAAANPATRDALAAGCTAALDAARQATQAMGCTW